MCSKCDRKLRIAWDVCISIVVLLGSVLLIYSALNGDRYRFDLQIPKVITYICFSTLFSRILVRMLSNRKGFWKYLCVIIFNLLCVYAIFIFNNILHYHGFASMFAYPKDIAIQHFIVSDLKYSLGLGMFRYVLLFGFGIITFISLDNGLDCIFWNGIKQGGEFLLETLGEVLDKLGLMKLFGLETVETVNDLEQTLEQLKENQDIKITTEYTDEEVIYEIRLSRDVNRQ